MSGEQDPLAVARATMAAEAAAINEAAAGLTPAFGQAVALLLGLAGKAALSGAGKSGLVARKIAATMASTGTPAFFLHPGDAGHGDLGMLAAHDCVIALSYSGDAAELRPVLSHCKRRNISFIMMTGQPEAPMAQDAELVIPVRVETEACPLNLAPTSSTTAMLALGDALAMAVLTARGFTADDFAATHPQGALGRRLLVRVADVMARGDEVPQVAATAAVADAVVEINAKRLGFTLVKHDDGVGMFTDGDLRRCLGKNVDIRSAAVSEFMTAKPAAIAPTRLAAEALALMEEKQITSLVVLDGKELAGVIDIHSLMQSQVA